jgi:ketosteroid isomerase-like protein
MHEILAIIRAYAEAWQRSDAPALAALYHDQFTLHYPGDHPLSGIHRGKPECLRILREVHARTGRHLIEIIAIMAGETRGALNVRERWRRDGEEAIVDRVFLYSVRDGLLDNCWLYDADQRLVARFLRDPAYRGEKPSG